MYDIYLQKYHNTTNKPLLFSCGAILFTTEIHIIHWITTL